MLNSDYIYQQLPIEIRPFFKIEMLEIPVEYTYLLDNIAQAIITINRFVHLNKTVALFVAVNPFQLELKGVRLSAQLFQPAVHQYVENLIFLDLNKMIGLPDHLQRATYLEELAHVLMNVKDERLVSVIVEEMLPDVQLVNNQYV